MARVVVLGSSNTDMTVRLPRLPVRGQTVLGGTFTSGRGGKGANQAIAARRAGADVIFLSAVGDDGLGQAAVEHYRREGIDVSFVRVVTGSASGVALIFVEEGGENAIGVAPGANALISPADIDGLPDSVFEGPGVFLASLEVPLETVSRALERARRGGMTTVLNPAPVPGGLVPEIVKTLAWVDVLTPNQSELLALCGRAQLTIEEVGEAAGALRGTASGLSIIVTLGARGCVVVDDKETLVPARPMTAIDTVGAGDCFNGALAVALAEGRGLRESAAWAGDAAALAITRPGAQDGLPRREEIDRLALIPSSSPPHEPGSSESTGHF